MHNVLCITFYYKVLSQFAQLKKNPPVYSNAISCYNPDTNKNKSRIFMNQKVLKTLEYNKIIHQLTGYAASAPGKLLCQNLLPMSDFHDDVMEPIARMDGDSLPVSSFVANA